MSILNILRCGGLLTSESKLDSEVMKIHKGILSEPHWYLAAVGIPSEFQGKGFSRKLFTPMLNYCDREHLAAYLETNNEKNSVIYQKYGFTVEHLEELRAVKGIDQWSMLRRPKS